MTARRNSLHEPSTFRCLRSGPARKIELPPRFVDYNGNGVCEIKAAAVRPHGQSDLRRQLLKDIGRQPAGFGPENKSIAGLIAHLIVASCTMGRYGIDAAAGEYFPAMLPIIVQRVIDPAAVIHAGALELFVGHGKSKRADQMQTATGIGGEPHHVAGVGWDFRLVQHDLEHANHAGEHSPSCNHAAYTT